MKLNIGNANKTENKPKAKTGFTFESANQTPSPDLKSQLAMTEEQTQAKKPSTAPSLKSLLQKGTSKPNVGQPATSATSANSALQIQDTQKPLQEQAKVSIGQTGKQTIAKQEQSGIPTLAPITEKYVLVATATPELPQEVLEGFSARMQLLVDHMQSQELPDILHDLLKYTQANKNLRPILRATDVQLFVRACRTSYGLVVTKKTGNTKKKAKTQANVQELMNDLADLDFTL